MLFKELPHQVVVSSIHCHIKVKPVSYRIEVLCCKHILRLTCCRIYQRDVRGRTNLCTRTHLVEKFHSLCLSKEHVVILLIKLLVFICHALHVAGSDHVTYKCEHVLLIDSQPVLYSVAIICVEKLCKFNKLVNTLSSRPATLFLKSRRKIKMEHCDKRLDSVLETLIYHVVVEVDSLLVDSACSFRENSAPRDGESECLEAHLSHEGYILCISVVKISAHVQLTCSRWNCLDILHTWTLAM